MHPSLSSSAKPAPRRGMDGFMLAPRRLRRGRDGDSPHLTGGGCPVCRTPRSSPYSGARHKGERMTRPAAQTLMESEAREAPAVAARLVADASGPLRRLGERLRALSPDYALAAGRGSSDAAAFLAKYLFEIRLGLPTVSVAPSVRSIYGRQLNLAKALVLAISQSGRSPDLIEQRAHRFRCFCHGIG